MSASEVLGDERGHDTTGGQREKWATEEEELLGLLGGIAGEDGGRDGTSQATAPSGLMLRAQHRQKFHKQPSASEPVFASVSDFEFKEDTVPNVGPKSTGTPGPKRTEIQKTASSQLKPTKKGKLCYMSSVWNQDRPGG
ncbi:hypothetical protein B0H13DRAFT_1857498 [Mycena leptocephala]|nr:hypothetical protein B0H13DRAFT_1857498 [Mycena leptocephala]